MAAKKKTATRNVQQKNSKRAKPSPQTKAKPKATVGARGVRGVSAKPSPIAKQSAKQPAKTKRPAPKQPKRIAKGQATRGPRVTNGAAAANGALTPSLSRMATSVSDVERRLDGATFGNGAQLRDLFRAVSELARVVVEVSKALRQHGTRLVRLEQKNNVRVDSPVGDPLNLAAAVVVSLSQSNGARNGLITK